MPRGPIILLPYGQATRMLVKSVPRTIEIVAVSIVKFRRAKLFQDARLAKIGVEDIARAMATMAGPKALADYDAGLTAVTSPELRHYSSWRLNVPKSGPRND